jgi:hypothetical protein
MDVVKMAHAVTDEQLIALTTVRDFLIDTSLPIEVRETAFLYLSKQFGRTSPPNQTTEEGSVI